MWPFSPTDNHLQRSAIVGLAVVLASAMLAPPVFAQSPSQSQDSVEQQLQQILRILRGRPPLDRQRWAEPDPPDVTPQLPQFDQSHQQYLRDQQERRRRRGPNYQRYPSPQQMQQFIDLMNQSPQGQPLAHDPQDGDYGHQQLLNQPRNDPNAYGNPSASPGPGTSDQPSQTDAQAAPTSGPQTDLQSPQATNDRRLDFVDQPNATRGSDFRNNPGFPQSGSAYQLPPFRNDADSPDPLTRPFGRTMRPPQTPAGDLNPQTPGSDLNQFRLQTFAAPRSRQIAPLNFAPSQQSGSSGTQLQSGTGVQMASNTTGSAPTSGSFIGAMSGQAPSSAGSAAAVGTYAGATSGRQLVSVDNAGRSTSTPQSRSQYATSSNANGPSSGGSGQQSQTVQAPSVPSVSQRTWGAPSQTAALQFPGE